MNLHNAVISNYKRIYFIIIIIIRIYFKIFKN